MWDTRIKLEWKPDNSNLGLWLWIGVLLPSWIGVENLQIRLFHLTSSFPQFVPPVKGERCAIVISAKSCRPPIDFLPPAIVFDSVPGRRPEPGVEPSAWRVVSPSTLVGGWSPQPCHYYPRGGDWLMSAVTEIDIWSTGPDSACHFGPSIRRRRAESDTRLRTPSPWFIAAAAIPPTASYNRNCIKFVIGGVDSMRNHCRSGAHVLFGVFAEDGGRGSVADPRRSCLPMFWR